MNAQTNTHTPLADNIIYITGQPCHKARPEREVYQEFIDAEAAKKFCRVIDSEIIPGLLAVAAIAAGALATYHISVWWWAVA